MNKCKTCSHWKNQQMLLNYCKSTGFCINPRFGFNTSDGRLIGVVDTHNLRDRVEVPGNPSNDFEVVNNERVGIKPSRYLLQTEEEFGCIFYNKEK